MDQRCGSAGPGEYQPLLKNLSAAMKPSRDAQHRDRARDAGDAVIEREGHVGSGASVQEPPNNVSSGPPLPEGPSQAPAATGHETAPASLAPRAGTDVLR
jgi:hypothetical protein